MKAVNFRQAIGLCALASFSASTSAQLAPLKWAPHIDLEAKPGSKRTLGEVDFFLPLHQDARTLVFANVRARMDDASSREGNLGLGVRQMQANGWNLGAYAYFDRRRTENDNYFNQTTLGLEALGRDFDLRANTYLPVGARARNLPEVSTAFLSGASIQVNTDLREERALKGFDLEAGWRTPLFDSEEGRQLRLYAGGYRFSDEFTTVQGPRLRLELALDQMPELGNGRIYLGVETQHDNVRGTQSFLSIRLRIPLGKENAYSNRLTAQERRMTAPVMRDVDIVTQSRVKATVNETAANTTSGQSITVINSATVTGAALPGAVAAAGNNSTVILAGTFNTTTTTTLQTGQTLMGAGSLDVRTPSGRTATLTTPTATINGSNVAGANATILMGDSSTLRGMTINDTETNATTNSIAVRGGGGSNITVIDNVITSNAAPGTGSTSHAITLVGGSNHLVSGNTLTANGGGSVTLALQFASASGVASNNYLTASGGSSNYYFVHNGATMLAGSTGNTVGSGTCQVMGGGSGSISFTNAPNCP